MMQKYAGGRRIPDYVDTLDGFRAAAAVLVMMFHFWQQSWVSMVVQIGPLTIDFTPIVSFGGVGVELLFMLSGFCLYYPLAMHPERKLNIGTYVYKRCVRILPSYLFGVVICSVYQIGRLDSGLLLEQFIGNMTLTQMSTASLSYNHLNPVFWSLAIEAQFYLIFPLLVKVYKKKPYWVMIAAVVIGETWRWYQREIDHSQINWLMNQLPGMIDVFVGGMTAAHVAAMLKRTLTEEQKKAYAPAFSLMVLMFFMVYIFVTKYIYMHRYDNLADNLSRLQMYTRKYLIISFAGMILCSVFSSGWVRKLFGNPITRFVAGISYQLYLWHMWICLRLKDFRIPSYVTERPMRVATIPVGYGDGYPRLLSSKGRVLIHGKSAPILGRVCMDQFMVDVSGIPEAKQNDDVTLMGRDGYECIPTEEISGYAGTINYEIVCEVGKRIPRVYIN